ncbi:hypothetical protein BZA77DRAFT_321251 [Pyronema omphalodes]|nr:hypothetical protein BZA77DRAFT_321251 [Pyronema omphalodes]
MLRYSTLESGKKKKTISCGSVVFVYYTMLMLGGFFSGFFGFFLVLWLFGFLAFLVFVLWSFGYHFFFFLFFAFLPFWTVYVCLYFVGYCVCNGFLFYTPFFSLVATFDFQGILISGFWFHYGFL